MVLPVNRTISKSRSSSVLTKPSIVCEPVLDNLFSRHLQQKIPELPCQTKYNSWIFEEYTNGCALYMAKSMPESPGTSLIWSDMLKRPIPQHFSQKGRVKTPVNGGFHLWSPEASGNILAHPTSWPISQELLYHCPYWWKLFEDWLTGKLLTSNVIDHGKSTLADRWDDLHFRICFKLIVCQATRGLDIHVGAPPSTKLVT